MTWDNEQSEWSEFDVDDEDDPENDQLPCPSCGKMVYDDTDQCPHCGDWIVPLAGSDRRSRMILIVVVAVTLLGVLGWIIR